ncbi:MAG TPA: type IX secretion system sortase PorU [bacterium]|nr:type IX secretion system sortase PorU [bacterium]HQI47686.1 type IX secretion system sortase PorU [bacterium]HQJ63458.1 type IX secretion system sortase PorU [bacterium]
MRRYSVLLYLGFWAAAAAAGTMGVRTLSSSSSGLVLEFIPQNWRIDSVRVDGRARLTFQFAGAEMTGAPGAPMLPARTVVAGIPPQGGVSLRVVTAEYEMRRGAVMPMGRLVPDGTLSRTVYDAVGSAASSQTFGPEVAVLSEPQEFRGQRTVRVTFHPVQAAPGLDQLRLYRRVVVELTFSGAGTTMAVAAAAGAEEGLYKELLVNYQQARSWRSAVPPRLAKPARTNFPGDNWYKIIIHGDGKGNKEGLYKITAAALSQAGVPLASIDPTTLQLFNNGGRELAENIATPRPDSLIENAILVSGESDGKFDSGDYILFYGRSLEGKYFSRSDGKYLHYINHYGYDNVYWLTFGLARGKRMQRRTSLPVIGELESSFKDLAFIEDEKSNIYKSGSDWLGFELARDKATYSQVFALPGAVPQALAAFRFQVAATTSGSHLFKMNVNGNTLGQVSLTGQLSAYSVRLSEFNAAGVLLDGNNTLGIDYVATSDISQAYVDWIEVEYPRRFQAVGDQLLFNAPLRDGTAAWAVGNFNRSEIAVYDVTSFSDVSVIEATQIEGATVRFADTVNSTMPRRYLAVTPAAYLAVSDIQHDASSNLRQARDIDYIIITHDHFYQQAMQLESLREDWNSGDRLETEVVKISDIYDEFSWGLTDPVAIRDFLAYVYNAWGHPGYVLLLGDGHYDYRNLYKYNTPNLIPPYESPETSEISSRTCDDWFTYLKGSGNGAQMAIGRLPVRTVDEAQGVITKLIDYETKSAAEEWRKTVTIVGDDELVSGGKGEEVEHTRQSEWLAEHYVPPALNVEKIYLMEYPAVRTASISGVTKPQASEAFINRINQGSLLINFIGHGADELLTHENIFNLSTDFEKVQNAQRYALWVASTCEFAYWDQPQKQSFAEYLVNAAGRGAVGMISSSRLVYSSENASLNYNLFNQLFGSYESTGKVARIGDAFMFAKRTSSASQLNNEKFVLLGDPAMRLEAPRYRATVDSLAPGKSLQALTHFTIAGSMDRGGVLWNDFSGTLLLRVFDARKPRTHVTEGGTTVDYILPGNTIFRGTAGSAAGRFAAQFIVPKDISYGGSDGRISLYLWSKEGEGTGYLNNLTVDGSALGLVDREGPAIKIHFGNPSFASGDYTTPNPILHVLIQDTLSGVNIAGDIGHQIIMHLDEEEGKNITERFQYNTGSYTAGELTYPLVQLTPGRHTLSVKAWDNSNNSTSAEVEFIVVAETGLTLNNLLNYPNPMSSRTQFTFEASQEAEVTIQLYTVSGRLVRKFPAMQAVVGFNIYPELWDGTDAEGDPVANGVYLYRVQARNGKGGDSAETDAIGKVIVAR